MVRSKGAVKRRAKGELAAAMPVKDGGRKTRRFKPGTKALREIRKAQTSEGVKGIPRARLAKMVRSLLPPKVCIKKTDGSYDDGAIRIAKDAMQVLHNAAEVRPLTIFTPPVVRATATFFLTPSRRAGLLGGHVCALQHAGRAQG